MKRVLGFDASSSTIGVSVVDYDDTITTLIHSSFFKPPKKGTIFERLAIVRDTVFNLLLKYNPDDIAIEDILLFMKGKSSAKTITMLAILNRTVGLAVYNQCGQSPTLLNIRTIRARLKVTNKIPKKEDMPEIVAKKLGIEFPWIKNKKDKIIKENYDVADAIAVSLGFIEVNKIPQKKVCSKKKPLKN